jgi:hypothetical protein
VVTRSAQWTLVYETSGRLLMIVRHNTDYEQFRLSVCQMSIEVGASCGGAKSLECPEFRRWERATGVGQPAYRSVTKSKVDLTLL